MTREEASFILANIDRRVCDDELNDALDMAIKALEQEPCEDCIRGMRAEDIRNGYMALGEKIALQGVKEKINNITEEMTRKGVDTKYFEPLKSYIEDRISECEE